MSQAFVSLGVEVVTNTSTEGSAYGAALAAAVGAGFFKTFDEAAEKTIRLELGPQIGVDQMLEVVHVPLDLFRFEGAGNDADDGRVANGCMHVVPGSHRDPRFLPAARKKELEELAQNPDARTERVIMGEHDAGFGVPVELKSGECMFHHSLNFHSTPKNTTDSHRRAFVIIYLPAGMCVTNTQAWDHPLVPLFEVAPGEPIIGSHFPVVG